MRRLLVAMTAALALTALLAGVAGAGGGKPKNVKKAKADIETAYECFLSGALGYTIEQKLDCVAGVTADPEFLALATEIQEANAQVAATTEPVVNRVTFRSPKAARVSFDIELSGESALPDQRGGAVLVREGGERVWKVSAKTLCGLLALQRPDVAASGPCAEVIANDRL